MMQTKVTFKGRREGLELQVFGYQDFESFVALVEAKLQSMGDFLTQSKVSMHVFVTGECLFTYKQEEQLTQMFSEYFLQYVNKDELARSKKKGAQPVAESKNYTKEINFWLSESQMLEAENCLIVYKNLRSGQFVTNHMGSIIIVGDVNPGAKVSAAGDIIISGWTRGELHAGALGDEKASITTKKFKGGQLRIASVIAVLDGTEDSGINGLERAVTENKSIVIDSVE